jgi:phage shock protein E
MNYFLKYKLTITGIMIGAIGGYLYYHFVGCASGACPITSKPLNSTLYGAMMGGMLLNMFQKENQKTNKMNIEKIIKEKQGTIVDVRTPGEFRAGNVKGSINIPMQEIQQRIDELKNFKQPLVLCCASGGRSGQAHGFLSRQGIECINGGSWLELNYIQSQNV